LTIKEGHDIGETVRQLIEQEADVADCAVHIDPD
jgi:divalent metal cation (Fe/Co/Zn/Cd) transporter